MIHTEINVAILAQKNRIIEMNAHAHTHTHTHTHTRIYIYIYVCVCVFWVSFNLSPLRNSLKKVNTL